MKRSTFFVSAITFLFIFIEMFIAHDLFIWLDEAFTLNTTSLNPVETIKRSLVFEGQPPLYFTLLSLWRLISPSIFFSRLFSILCAAVAIPFFYNLITKVYKVKNPLIITFIFAFNPMLAWAGLEIRVYALMILMSVLLYANFLN